MSHRPVLDSVTLRVLCENTVARAPGLLGEWGLSVWIEAGEERVLFDAGEQAACVLNAPKLGVDLGRADAVVVSHGHFDHTGGLARALPLMPGAKVFLHPAVFSARYAVAKDIQIDPRAPLEIGLPGASREALARHTQELVEGPTQVVPGIWATGPIPREEPVEGPGGLGHLDPGRTRLDPIEDDLALWAETGAGILVILGCAHSGVINTLRFVQQQVDSPIVGVVGGTHLREISEERMKATLAHLKSLPLQLLAPCHCTGAREAFELRRAFPDQFRSMSVGDVIRFPEAG